jgi:hypothetical protein
MGNERQREDAIQKAQQKDANREREILRVKPVRHDHMAFGASSWCKPSP